MDLMIDVETLGKKPGCIVANFACMDFHPDTDAPPSNVLEIFIDVAASKARGLTEDPETVAWWETQPADVRAAALGGTCEPSLAYSHIHNRLSQHHYHRVWMRGLTFDGPILDRAMYEILGYWLPWRHYKAHEVRTVLDAFGLHKGPHLPGEEHTAYGDCQAQIRDVRRAFAIRQRVLEALRQEAGGATEELRP